MLICLQKVSAAQYDGNGRVWTLTGIVVDMNNKPLPSATITISELETSTSSDKNGRFNIAIPEGIDSIRISVSYAGKKNTERILRKKEYSVYQEFLLLDLNLKLPEVEISSYRKKTKISNSSIVFDREAIEQSQSLSLANVLHYLPGKTILKPNVSLQGPQVLTMRNALPLNGIEATNNAFGISVVMDDAVRSNDANMQTMGLTTRGSAYQINPPETRQARRNGTLYDSYNKVSRADNGIDLREIPVENIERIEVVSGVASARYGDYTTGMVIIDRQAGITPWSLNLRNNEGTQNVALTKGFKLTPDWGVFNFNLNYLNSNDDPRNKIKSFNRVASGFIWTYQGPKANRFRNNLSFDFNTTLDATKEDPDASDDRSARYKNTHFSVSNRSEFKLHKPWIKRLSLQGSFSWGKQDAYDQYYLNSSTVEAITDAVESGVHEGYYIPGYYLAVRQIIGKPVNASARIEAGNLFTKGKTVSNLTIGANYSYSANKGPGIVIDPRRPRFADQTRPRPYYQTPANSNIGAYIQNDLRTTFLGKPISLNTGIRSDFQNAYFTLSPRLSMNYKLSKSVSWNTAYGISTKAPSISQINPGDSYLDIPLLNVYNGSVNESIYLAYTEVVKGRNLRIKPYKNTTLETGFSFAKKAVQWSFSVFKTISKDGFTTQSAPLFLSLPAYRAITSPGTKPSYELIPDSANQYLRTVSKLVNGAYSRNSGVEIMLNTQKIRALQTSFSLNTALYYSYYRSDSPSVYIPEPPRLDLEAVYGVFQNSESKGTSIKSTLISSTHIPKLRMAIILTGEIFWVSKQQLLPTFIYPVGYYDRNLSYHPLSAEEARQPAYAHLLKTAPLFRTTYNPSFVYPNIHARLSKEIGPFLRFSFNAYNIFNLRPREKTATGYSYYNGQPSYGAELKFTIK
ncbi:TonB-dependent receptor [Niabella aurantiaca]|uniref:TonB-dependent receptor n=1 Tax=Niabella aurantiaca TaxID=379900 RepID=UPI0003624D96|nr:TonB-dependent receptor [Niabella aurantiaca]